MKKGSWKKRIPLFILIGALAIFIFGSVVMLLWNNVLTPVLHVSTVTFWQALGILVLSKILFGSFGKGAGPRGFFWKQRRMWDKMTPEQREKLKAQWQNLSNTWENKQSPEMGAEQGNTPA